MRLKFWHNRTKVGKPYSWSFRSRPVLFPKSWGNQRMGATPIRHSYGPNDSRLEDGGRLSGIEKHFMDAQGEKGLFVMRFLFFDLEQAVAYYMDLLMQQCGRLLEGNDSLAERVRSLRLEDRASWRVIAETIHEEGDGQWNPPFNQFAGLALCLLVADRASESGLAPPWNDQPLREGEEAVWLAHLKAATR